MGSAFSRRSRSKSKSKSEGESRARRYTSPDYREREPILRHSSRQPTAAQLQLSQGGNQPFFLPPEDPDPCRLEETFYENCRGQGHSTIKCERADANPDHICRSDPRGQATWTKISPDFPLCPACDDVDQWSRRSVSSDFDRQWLAQRKADVASRGWRQPHRDSFEWDINRR